MKDVLSDGDIKFQHDFNNKFKESYSMNPKKTLKLMEMCVYELGYDLDDSITNNNKIYKFLLEKKNRYIVYIVLGIIVSLFSIEGILIFFAGCAFFLAGHSIALFSNNKGGENIIFLFSHGLIGLLIMIGSFVGFMIDYIFTSQVSVILLICSIICFICGFIRTVLIGLSKNDVPFKDNVFLFYILGFIFLAILRVLSIINAGGIYL